MNEKRYWLSTALLIILAAIGYGITAFFFASYAQIANNLVDAIALALIGLGLLGYFYQKKEFLFLKILGGALACCFLARLFSFLYWWVKQDSPQNFSVEDLSLWGFYFFLFSADFGALDRIVDDKSQKMWRYRLIALLMPALVALAVIAAGQAGASWKLTILDGLFLALTGYYSLKMLIIPDIEEGFVRVLRPYHAILTVLVALESLKLFGAGLGWYWPVYGLEWVILSAILLLLPAAIRGIEHWFII